MRALRQRQIQEAEVRCWADDNAELVSTGLRSIRSDRPVSTLIVDPRTRFISRFTNSSRHGKHHPSKWRDGYNVRTSILVRRCFFFFMYYLISAFVPESREEHER